VNKSAEFYIPLALGLITFIGYVVFLIIRKRFSTPSNTSILQQKIGQMNVNTSKAAMESEASLNLIKEKGVPGVSETYFKSKLPKIEGYKEWIQHAGLDIRPFIFALICLSIGISIGFAFFIFLHANKTLSSLLAIASAFLVPWAVVSILSRRRKNQFLENFPNALDMIRRALRSGHSVERAIEMVAAQEQGLVGESFRTITERMRLGETLEAVLTEMSNKVGVDEFRMFSIVLILQRETGGSLSEATENFSKIIRARQNLRKKVKALTAEARVSAIILTLIPFFILGSVYISSPHYLDPLLYNPAGQKVLVGGALMMTTGIVTILRMVYKEIY
jgi:tight adherence protein B